MWNIDNHVLAVMFVVVFIHQNRRRGESSGKRIAVHRSMCDLCMNHCRQMLIEIIIFANVAKEREILLLFSVHTDVVLFRING